VFRDDPTLAPRVLGELERSDAPALTALRTQIRGLVALYAGEDSRLLNFYGRPGSVRTIPYDEVLAAPVDVLSSWFRGRAVFVGYGELQQLEQVEHFATAMSSASGPDLSGVEIAATAFANLLRGESMRELPLLHSLGIVLLAGLLSTVLCQRLGYRAALAATLVVLVAYGSIAVLQFAGAALRLPIVGPMLVAAPAGVLASFTWQYWTARRQRERLRRAFAYFVPREVVSRIEHNAEEIGRSAESLDCACVATDAANYTPLAETMSPERLTEFLNHYYEALFGGVAKGGGFVSDVVGDAMLAIWPGRAPDTRLRMLNALLEMRDAAERFNERLAGNRLVTRFGVDWGRVALTTVGAGTHYEYRAVGDAVNTAARIQDLNKKLGTRVLISQPALGDATGDFLLRDLGRFWLRGKSNPVHVFELRGRRTLATDAELDLCTSFAAAMAALNDGEVARAQNCFHELHDRFPTDGPTKLYEHALQSGTGFQLGALKPD
jgi:adenylate cyclase